MSPVGPPMYRIVMVPITVNQLLDHAARTTR
jgi:hypothetical protein